MGSGIAIVGFAPRNSMSEGCFAPFPSALGQQHIEQLGCFLSLEKVRVVVEFRAGNRDQIYRCSRTTGLSDSKLLVRKPPQQPAMIIREPDRTVTEAQRIPALADPLPHHLVCRGINTSERHIEDSCPNRIRSIADVAASAGNA